jgi:hypothetical protein
LKSCSFFQYYRWQEHYHMTFSLFFFFSGSMLSEIPVFWSNQRRIFFFNVFNPSRITRNQYASLNVTSLPSYLQPENYHREERSRMLFSFQKPEPGDWNKDFAKSCSLFLTCCIPQVKLTELCPVLTRVVAFITFAIQHC